MVGPRPLARPAAAPAARHGPRGAIPARSRHAAACALAAAAALAWRAPWSSARAFAGGQGRPPRCGGVPAHFFAKPVPFEEPETPQEDPPPEAAGVSRDDQAAADATGAELAAAADAAPALAKQPAGFFRAPALFPFVAVEESSDEKRAAADLATACERDSGGIAELLLKSGTPDKLLYVLAKMPPWAPCAAQVTGKRLDRRMRLRVISGFRADAANGTREVRVAKSTDPKGLAVSLRKILFEAPDSFRRASVRMNLAGREPAVVAMRAIEMLYAMTRKDITFMPRFMNEGMNLTEGFVGMSVSLTAGFASQETEQEPEELIAAEPQDEYRTVNFTPSATPSLFPRLTITNLSSPMGVATKATAMLDVHSTRIVDLVMNGAEARGQEFPVLARFPPWLRAVGTVAPRTWWSKPCVRVVKNFPALSGSVAAVSKVSGSTNYTKLGDYLVAKLQDRLVTGRAVQLKMVGRDSLAVASRAIEHMRWSTQQEVGFTVERMKTELDKAGYVITAMFV